MSQGTETEIVLKDPFQQILIRELRELRLQVKRVADLQEKRAQGRERLVDCFKCGQKVKIRGKAQGSGYDLFNATDNSPHICKGLKPPPTAPGNSVHSSTNDPAVLMNFLVTIWPKEPSAGTAAVTDCGDHWEIPNPRINDRDKWKEFAAALRIQFGGEYVSEPENRKYYFRVEKPKKGGA